MGVKAGIGVRLRQGDIRSWTGGMGVRTSGSGHQRGISMKRQGLSRRDVLKGSTAAGLTVFASPIRAAAPPPEAITPTLVEAAKKEGTVAFYTAMDLAFAQRLGKTFEDKFGVAVHVERSGPGRFFTRFGQEYTAKIMLSTWSTRPTRRIVLSGS